MQRKQGYCSYCRVQYPNLEQETKIKGICHQQTLTKGKTKRSSSGRRKMIPDGSSEITGSNEEQWKAFVQCSAQKLDQTE